MTELVNTETGEILDVEAAERRASFICTDLDFAATSFETAMGRMREAIADRDDIALGYRSPGDYLSERFGGRLARLGVDLRREVVRELTEAGLSTRAIAPVVGVSNYTVHADQKAAPVRDLTPQTPEPASAGEADAGSGQTPEGEGHGEAATASVVDPSPRPPVTGIDGKTYKAPEPKPAATPKPVLVGGAAEYDNAAQSSLALARAITKFLQLQHPNMRVQMRRCWSMASAEVPPTPRRDVTPEQMRVAAQGLLDLANEWESQ